MISITQMIQPRLRFVMTNSEVIDPASISLPSGSEIDRPSLQNFHSRVGVKVLGANQCHSKSRFIILSPYNFLLYEPSYFFSLFSSRFTARAVPSKDAYPPRVLFTFLRSLASMTAPFCFIFVRSIRTTRLRIHNVLGAPRYYARPVDPAVLKVINELVTATSAPRCALYARSMVVAASDQYRMMPKRDLHALDLLVQHNQAPFTIQSLEGDSGEVDRALVSRVSQSMKVVSGMAIDAVQAAPQLLPVVPHRHADLLKPLERVAPNQRQDGVVAWCAQDLVTHRFFREVPPDQEQRFFDIIATCHDIEDDEPLPMVPGAAEQNRVRESVHMWNRGRFRHGTGRPLAERLHTFRAASFPLALRLVSAPRKATTSTWSLSLTEGRHGCGSPRPDSGRPAPSGSVSRAPRRNTLAPSSGVGAARADIIASVALRAAFRAFPKYVHIEKVTHQPG